MILSTTSGKDKTIKTLVATSPAKQIKTPWGAADMARQTTNQNSFRTLAAAMITTVALTGCDNLNAAQSVEVGQCIQSVGGVAGSTLIHRRVPGGWQFYYDFNPRVPDQSPAWGQIWGGDWFPAYPFVIIDCPFALYQMAKPVE